MGSKEVVALIPQPIGHFLGTLLCSLSSNTDIYKCLWLPPEAGVLIFSLAPKLLHYHFSPLTVAFLVPFSSNCGDDEGESGRSKFTKFYSVVESGRSKLAFSLSSVLVYLYRVNLLSQGRRMKKKYNS